MLESIKLCYILLMVHGHLYIHKLANLHSDKGKGEKRL
jgi:hypothetical protein